MGGRRVGDPFWLVSEFGEKSQYVRNIKADPRVRVRGRWHPGTAHLLPDDEVSLADWDSMLVASVRENGRDWIPAMGNSDAHRSPDPVGSPQTVVLADDLTREAIQEGIRAGRSYIAESKNVSLTFTASGGRGRQAGIGGRLEVDRDTPVTVRLEATGAPRCTVRFVTDQGVLFTSAPLPVSGSGVVEWRTTPSYAAYVRAELRHEAAVGPLPGALAAFTNPIFLGRP